MAGVNLLAAHVEGQRVQGDAAGDALSPPPKTAPPKPPPQTAPPNHPHVPSDRLPPPPRPLIPLPSPPASPPALPIASHTTLVPSCPPTPPSVSFYVPPPRPPVPSHGPPPSPHAPPSPPRRSHRWICCRHGTTNTRPPATITGGLRQNPAGGVGGNTAPRGEARSPRPPPGTVGGGEGGFPHSPDTTMASLGPHVKNMAAGARRRRPVRL